MEIVYRSEKEKGSGVVQMHLRDQALTLQQRLPLGPHTRVLNSELGSTDLWRIYRVTWIIFYNALGLGLRHEMCICET